MKTKSESSAINEITRQNVALIAKMEAASNRTRTFGQRVADNVAKGVGSWTFLIIQSLILLLWMCLNIIGHWSHWDPYPFILLNLVLSFQAAFATPVILMSQNRQARLSEQRNQLDLQINMLAEQENTEQLRLLRLLCAKAGLQTNSPMERALEEATHPDEIISQIVEQTNAEEAREAQERTFDHRGTRS